MPTNIKDKIKIDKESEIKIKSDDNKEFKKMLLKFSSTEIEKK
jgi:hypothetical protein